MRQTFRKHVPEWQARRKQIADFYFKELSAVPSLRLIHAPQGAVSSNHLFVMRHQKRDWLKNELEHRGIETGIHYPIPCHLQPAWLAHYPAVQLPHAEAFARSCLSLPMHGEMTDEEARQVTGALKEILK